MGGFLTPSHTLLLLIVVLVLFGAKRLPELGHSLGKGMLEFKRSLDGEPRDERVPLSPPPAPEPTPITGRVTRAGLEDGMPPPAA